MSERYIIAVIPQAPEDGGGYLGVVGDLPGCMSHADTPEEALAGAQAAILEWIDEAREQGIAIPEPGNAAKKFKDERAALLTQLKSQKQAFEKLDGEVKVLRANIETLLADAFDPDDRTPQWLPGSAVFLTRKKEHNVQ